MKKTKKIALALILGISSLAFAGMVNASTFSIAQGFDVVCDQESLNPGDTADCWIIGNPQANGENPSIHSYITHAFGTKNLKIIANKTNPTIQNTNATMTEADEIHGEGKLNAADLPTEAASYQCVYDPEFVGRFDKTYGASTGFVCGLFYTVKDKENAFTPQTLKSNNENLLSQKIITNTTQQGAIGYYRVQLDENSTGSDCGAICVALWSVPTKDNFTDYKTTTADNSNITKEGKCTEIHRNETPTPQPSEVITETGAFASYAVLAVGALIAISAVAIAKKNNRFSKI